MSTLDPTFAPGAMAAPAATLTPEQTFDMLVEQQELLRRREAELLSLQDQQDQTKRDVINAELEQNDLFTKRARPMVVYAGLVFIFINYVLFPAIGQLSGKQLAALALPEDFWWAWGGIVATWSIGRSFEKTGASNRVTRMITGNKSSAAAALIGRNHDGAVG